MHDRSTGLELFGRAAATIRRKLRVRQIDLAAAVGISTAHLSAIENGLVRHLDMDLAGRLCAALGGTLVFGIELPPALAGSRQTDAAHALAVAHVARRLAAAGWLVAREVPIGGLTPTGWIDILAYHPELRVVLVIEVKTRLADLGETERQIQRYEMAAMAAAAERGWAATRTIGALLVLATEENDRFVSRNRAAFDSTFPVRSAGLQELVAGEVPERRSRRGIAMIDPRSKRRAWLRPLAIDGRRAKLPYRDYADFVNAGSGRD